MPSQMPNLTRGLYTAKLAENRDEVRETQGLRHLSFRVARGLAPEDGHDSDKFDAACQHMLIRETASNRLVCCYRILPVPAGVAIGHSYSAQFYDLGRLRDFPGPMLELGRFCLHPDHHDPDILRLAWAALTRLVDYGEVKMLFGCSSFHGTDPTPHYPALAHLAAHHLAPPEWSPGVKGGETVDLRLLPGRPDPKAMPPLLQTYLAMGAWVSGHAVIDHELNTLHVFTGLDISAVPAARARALRDLAG